MIISWPVSWSSFRPGQGTHQNDDSPDDSPDEPLGREETSFVRLATELSQVTVNFIFDIFTCEFVLSGILMRYKLGETAVIILLANGTFGATLNDFAKQKGDRKSVV